MCKMLKLALILILINLCNCVETRNIRSEYSDEDHLVSKEYLIDVNTFFNKIGNIYKIVKADSNSFYKDSSILREYLLIEGTIWHYRDSLILSYANTLDNCELYKNYKNFNLSYSLDLNKKIIDYYKTTLGPRWEIYFLDFNIYYPPRYNDCSRYYLTTTNGTIIE